MPTIKDTDSPLIVSVFDEPEKPTPYTLKNKIAIGFVLAGLMTVLILTLVIIHDEYIEIQDLLTRFSLKRLFQLLIHEKTIFLPFYLALIVCGFVIKKSTGWIMNTIIYYHLLALIIITTLKDGGVSNNLIGVFIAIPIIILNIMLLNRPILKRFYKLSNASMYWNNIIALCIGTILAAVLVNG